MATKSSFGLLLASLFLAATGVAHSQTAALSGTATRLAGDWRSTAAIQLATSATPRFRAGADRGMAAANLQLNRMILLLAPSPAQQKALTAKLADLENPNSAAYHHWLTPAEYAAQFANTPQDVAAVVAWLQGQGFSVAALPASRGWIEFSGTASQVEQAFGSDLHLVSTAYGTKPVLAGEITVPSALAPLVQGLVSLDGVTAAPAVTAQQQLTVSVSELAQRSNAATAEALTPALMGQLLHFDTLRAKGITGAGVRIAIPARGTVNLADVDAFRAAFGLPAQTLAVNSGGRFAAIADDQAVATLMASWAGAAAPAASLQLVAVPSTAATDGLDLALASIVDGQLAKIAVVGYNSCEAGLSAAHQAFYASLYQQAAAEGISLIVAAGDAGGAACTVAGSSAPVSTGLAVNGLASTPWNTAVGVAAFTASDAKTLAGWTPGAPSDPAYAGGGGYSSLHARPSWQSDTVVHGTAAYRTLPDVALPVAIDATANQGVAFCLSATTGSEGCSLVRAGGSSAAAAIFGGITALIAEANGAQGSLENTLYSLASKSGVYSDVAAGNAKLACTAGSDGCDAAGQIGYSAASGYDMATGLGVVNAASLIANWAQPMLGTAATTISMSVSPAQTNSTYNPSASITFTAQVLSNTGGTTPTGTVVFYDNTTTQSLSLPINLDATGTATTVLEGVFALGGNQMVAQYSGDSTYAAATSNPPVNINTQASTTSLTVTPAVTTAAPGQKISVVVTLTVGTPAAGSVDPVGVITLNVDGGQETYTASLTTVNGVTTATFANVLMPANSSLTSHTLQAVYPANTDYAGSTSPQVTITMAKTTPTVTVTPSTTTPLPGASLTLTASVAPTVNESMVPSGTVTFYVDGVAQSAVAVTAGSPASSASLTVTGLANGTHTLSAVYGGDSNYNTATSANVSITVAQAAPTLTLTAATTTPATGATDVLTATLAQTNTSGVVPSGNITFQLDGATVGYGALNAAGTTATYSMTMPAQPGAHTVQAIFPGDTNFTTASSAVLTLNVAKIVTTLAVTPSTTTPAVGATMQVSTTITPSSYTTSNPTGTVTFLLDGTTTLGTATVTAGAPSTATLSFTMPSSGAHTIQATYSGDTYYATSSATSTSITVAKTTTTLTITPATTTPTAGSTVQVQAYVYPATAQSTLPTGTITYTLDGVTMGTATVASGSPATATYTLTVGASGTHTLAATYSGDTNYATSTATAVTLTVGKSTPTVTVTPATTAPAVGGTLQLTATVTPGTTTTTYPSGTVSFSVDGTTVGTTALTAGSPSTATLTVSMSTLGSHQIVAAYNGDTNYNAATSSAATVIVGKATTTLTVTPASTTPAANSTMLVTATLASTSVSTLTATGTVTFLLDNATVASATLNGSSAGGTITVPATGTHTIQATYSGDANYYGSTASAVNITVTKTTTTTTITPSTSTPALGAALPITVTVTPSALNTTTPSGAVTISVDGVATTVQTLSTGNPATASATLASLSPGSHTLAATYSGDGYYATSTSAMVTVTVPKVATTTAVMAATTTPSGGSSLAVSASITPVQNYSTLPTGTVSFTLDGVSVSSVAVISGSPATATATIASTSLTPGSHVLAAVYSGDTVYATSTSASTTLTIAKSPTTTTVVPSTLTPTAGGSMTVSVDVTSSSPATAMPSGTVTLLQDGVSVGSATLTPGSPSVGTVTMNVVSAGTHVLQASYSGDTYYTSSNSSTVSIAANRGASVTTLTATPTTLTAGKTETLTATLTPYSSVTGVTYTLSGTVKFYDGATLLGTVAVSNNTAVLSGVSLAVNQNHTITAIYSGDTNWTGSTSSALTLSASTLPTYIVLTANYSVAPPGVAVVLTATVTPTSVSTTEPNPTGTVIFYIGTTAIGTATLKAISAISNASVATLTTQTLPAGQDTIYAVYMGDDYYTGATSNNLSIVVQDFTITPSSSNPATNLTIVKGSSGSASFDIAGVGGFNNLVQVVCAVPSQDDMTCTATPQQVTPPGTVTFVVQTFTSGTVAQQQSRPQFWPRALGGTALAALGFLFLPFGRRVRQRLSQAGRTAERGVLLLLLLMGVVGSGVGCTNSQSVASTGTPLGVATLKISATAYVNNTTIAHSVYLTVNVVKN